MIKILTKNAVENTNIDGARDSYFNCGNRSGIVKGALNEGRIFASASNVLALETCELRIAGHRVIIDQAESYTFNNAPATAKRYAWVAQIKVSETSDPEFSLIMQDASAGLKQDNLYSSLKGSGIYQVELCRLTLNTNGEIENLVRSVPVIAGLGYGSTSVLINGEAQKVVEFTGQPQKQIDDLKQQVEDIVEPAILEATQGSEIFLENTPTGKLPLKVLGNTTQDVSPNLFDYNNININNTTKSNNGYQTTIAYFNATPITLKSNTQYIVSIDIKKVGSNQSANLSGRVFIRDSKDKIIGATTNFENNKRYIMTFTTNETITYSFQIYGYGDNNNENNYFEFSNIQFEQGSVATPYQPYTGQPSPDNPIAVNSVVSPISVESSNSLASCVETTKGFKELSQLVEDNRNCVRYKVNANINNLVDKFKPNTQYTISFDAKWNYDSNYNAGEKYVMYFFYEDGTTSRLLNNSVKQNIWNRLTYTSGKNKTLKSIGILNMEYRIWTYIDIDSFTIQETNSDLQQPYKKTATSFSITDINGIVHKMNGIGNVHDNIIRKDNKVYFEKRFEKEIFNGSEQWNSGGTNSPNFKRFAVYTKKDIKPQPNPSLKSNILCDIFSNGSASGTYTRQDNTIAQEHDTLNHLIMYSSQYNTEEALALWKFHLSLHPMEVIYELKTPEYYELDETEVLKMYADTFNGGTYLSATSQGAKPIMDFRDYLIDIDSKSVIIRDKERKSVFPITSEKQVMMGNGSTLEERMAQTPTRVECNVALMGVPSDTIDNIPIPTKVGNDYKWKNTIANGWIRLSVVDARLEDYVAITINQLLNFGIPTRSINTKTGKGDRVGILPIAKGDELKITIIDPTIKIGGITLIHNREV